MRIIAWTQKIESMASCNPVVFNLTMLYYKKMIRKEVTLAGITEKDRVLCIGGGPCPHTAILIHKLTGARIKVVDNDINAVRYSKELISRLNLSEAFEIIHCEGNCAETDNCSVVHIALQVTEKEKVLNHIKESLGANTRILVRLPKNKLKSLYDSFTEKYAPGSKKVKHGLFVNVNCTAMYEV